MAPAFHLVLPRMRMTHDDGEVVGPLRRRSGLVLAELSD